MRALRRFAPAVFFLAAAAAGASTAWAITTASPAQPEGNAASQVMPPASDDTTSSSADPPAQSEAEPVAIDRCRELLGEVNRRESDGRITEADFDEGPELTEEQFETMDVPSSPFDGSVDLSSPDQLETFPDRLVLETVSNEDVILSTERCFEEGLLADDDSEDEDEDEDDEE